MRAKATWIEGRAFMLESGSGHALVADAPVEAGGRALGPSPMELVLMGAGACTAVDVVGILEKMRQQVTACTVDLEAGRATEPPRVFTRIVLRFRVAGRALDRAAVERAVALSAEKYCSATILLGKTAEIVREIELLEAPRARDSRNTRRASRQRSETSGDDSPIDVTRRRSTMRNWLAPLLATVLLGATGETLAANVCYDALALDSNRSVGFLRLRTRSGGSLVPPSEGPFTGPAQAVFEADGKLAQRIGLVVGGVPQLEMQLVTGTVLVVAGKGAQMSLLTNFGRLANSPPGFSVLDCGSTTPSGAPPSWVCRGAASFAVQAVPVTEARALRLQRVDATRERRCRDYAVRAN
jgi:putative redox protein